ncbi:MAG: hypothetical protein IH840_11030 [Candidatus Heimdallarchaeota archaeon]|nr:hypothetical protein [Candidatus Heimdallarchaeota archaeon]
MKADFALYPDDMTKYHLYASKTSEERISLAQKLLPIFEDIDSQLRYHHNYETQPLQKSVSQMISAVLPAIHKMDNSDKYELQNTYFIVDNLLFTPVILDLDLSTYLPEIADTCSEILNPYVVLHELAILSWYDNLILPKLITDRILTYQLSRKEKFHVLGELSLRFPVEIISFQTRERVLDQHYQDRLIQKFRISRSKKLKKDFEIVLDLEEINELIKVNFMA